MTTPARRFTPITAAQLREHGLLIESLGWLTLLVAVFVLALVPGPVGQVIAILLCVLGLVKILVGLHWRSRTGR